MPPGSSRERQSVYEKALLIVSKDKKLLTNLNRELEEHKLHKYIDYKLQERKLRKELTGLRQEQKRFANEAFKRVREHKTIDDVAKEIKRDDRSFHLETMRLKAKFTKLPQISCTQRNVPRIMRRDLSAESEYYTWTFGMPKRGYREASSDKLPAIDQTASSLKRLRRKENKSYKTDQENLKHQINVHRISYDIPLTQKENKSESNTRSTKLPPLP